MNFNAHVLVAQLVDNPADGAASLLGLGSALPDLASIAGCRLVHEPQDRWLRRGVELHHVTDRAFHNHHWFIARQGQLFEQLQGRGLARGASRACAHVGIELLIDGYLLRTRTELAAAVEDSFLAIDAIADQLADLPAEENRQRWQAFLNRSAKWPRPGADDYTPSAVSERLYKILEPRRRLRFESAQIDVVNDVLGDLVHQLEPELEELVTDVVDAVGAPPN